MRISAVVLLAVQLLSSSTPQLSTAYHVAVPQCRAPLAHLPLSPSVSKHHSSWSVPRPHSSSLTAPRDLVFSSPFPSLSSTAELLKLSATSTSEDDCKLSVVVVGAGPAGLAAASTLLGTEKVDSVTVVERQSLSKFGSIDNSSFGIGLGPRVRQEIEEIDLESSLTLLNETGRIMGRFIMTQQQKIRKSFYQDLKVKYPESTFKVLFDETPKEIAVSERCLRTLRGTELKYDLLVIADGVHSKTRQMLQNPKMQVDKRASGLGWKSIIAPLDALPNLKTSLQMKAESKHGQSIMAIVPQREGYFFLSFFPTEEGRNPAGASSVAELKDYFLSMTPGSKMAEELLGEGGWSEVINSLPEEIFQSYIDSPLKFVWISNAEEIVDRDNGIVMVGDAAHAQPNLLGQGVTSAVQDAKFLSGAILEAFSEEGVDIDRDEIIAKALSDYNLASQKEAKAIQEINLIAAWLRRKKLLSPVLLYISRRLMDPKKSFSRTRSRLGLFYGFAKARWDRESISEEEAISRDRPPTMQTKA